MSTASRDEGQPAWHTILPVGTGTALSLVGDTAMYAVLPTHTAEAGVLLANVGVLLSVNRFVRLGANSAVGWIIDRRSRRAVFLLALLLGALSTAMYAVTRGFWALLVARLLWGISWAGIWVSGNDIVLEAAGSAKRGRWVGYYHLVYFLGTGISALLGGGLTDWLGFHRAMGIGAGVQLLGVFIAWGFLPADTREATASQSTSGVGLVASGVEAADGELATTADPPDDESNVGVPLVELGATTALLAVCRLLVSGVWVSTLGLFILEAMGDGATVFDWRVGVGSLTGAGLAASTFLSMMFMPLVVGLSDYTKSRWWFASAGMIAGTAGFLLLTFESPGAFVLGVPLLALANSSGLGLSTALTGDLAATRRRGRLLGVLYTVGDLGSAVGPPLAFALLPMWSLQDLYLLGAGIFGFMLLVSLQRALSSI